MASSSRYFDADLPRVGSDKLKPMARMWGGNYKLRKEECIALITQSLKDRVRVEAAIASLEDYERNALALLKRLGGLTDYNSLLVGLLAIGESLPSQSRGYSDPGSNLANDLLRRGLILGASSSSPDYLDGSFERDTVYSDSRLLAQVGPLRIKPFQLQPMPVPLQSIYRRPPTVALDIIGMVQAVDNLGGLKLTQAGQVRVNEAARLRKALHWNDQGIGLDGFIFPDPVTAWLHALAYSDVLMVENDRVVTRESSDQFAVRPFAEQARMFMEGFIRSNQWWELVPSPGYDSNGKGRRRGRLALTMALAALPLDTGGFFSLDDFDQALYARVGEYFALDYPPRRPYKMYNEAPAETEKKLADWRIQTRRDWLKQERPWIEKALTTWLYFLGLVELGMDQGVVIGLRLTQLGKEVFHPELASAVSIAPKASTTDLPGWVVQPNFDIIVYLERTSPQQLAFLERHTERVQAHAHTAHYRLSRETVYRGLESGSTLEELLETLAAGAHAPLPQNVVVEIREWASLRERLTLHRRAALLEFPNTLFLYAALEAGVAGTVVGDRFLLLPQQSRPMQPGWVSIDYAQALPKCITVSEDGHIRLKRGYHDLIIEAQLSHWAERQSDSDWQLTAASVAAALKNGLRLNQLFTLLSERLTHKLPQLLALALRAWGGESSSVELEPVVVLRCSQEQVFEAIMTSPKTRSFLKGYLYPDLLFVDKDQVDALRSLLDWAGFAIEDRLYILPLK